MAILKKFKPANSNKTTKGFYFGHTEAEGENKSEKQNLISFFEDYLGVLPSIHNEKFFFIGRKGAGKSAIAKFIKDSSDKEDDSFADIIRFNDIELEKLLQSIPVEQKDNIETLIFEWLILVRLIRLFVKNESAVYTNEHKKFKHFIERNAGFAEIDKYHIDEIIQKKKLEVSIDVLKHVFGPTIGKYVDTKSTKAPFYQFVNPLKEIIEQVLDYDVFSSKEFIILFDDLDIKFKADNETSKQKLLSLLRAARDLNTGIFKNTSARVLVFLRDDIRDVLETKDSDTSKMFSSYAIPLTWYDHYNFKREENKVNLKKFANKRIALNFEANGLSFDKNDPWHTLFSSNDHELQGKSSFKYFLDYTFYRPRDIVLFLSEIGENEYTYPLNTNCIKSLIHKFIRANIKELKSELAIHFSPNETKLLFEVLKALSSSSEVNGRDRVMELIEEKLPNHDSSSILKFLIDYSILVLIDRDHKLYFNYRSNELETIDFENLNLTCHKSIFRYFNPEKR